MPKATNPEKRKDGPTAGHMVRISARAQAALLKLQGARIEKGEKKPTPAQLIDELLGVDR